MDGLKANGKNLFAAKENVGLVKNNTSFAKGARTSILMGSLLGMEPGAGMGTFFQIV